MVTQIRLYGVLGKKFGRRWQLDISSPAEAVRALESLKPGFAKELIELECEGFRVRVGDRLVTEQELTVLNEGDAICFTPVYKGSGGDGMNWGQIILGVVLVVVGIVTVALGGSGTLFIIAGVGMIAGGVAGLLAGTPSFDSGGNPDKKKRPSYTFTNAVNTIEQGMPFAVAYGDTFAGSAVISLGIETQDITYGATGETGGTDGVSGGGGGGGGGANSIVHNRPKVPLYPN